MSGATATLKGNQSGGTKTATPSASPKAGGAPPPPSSQKPHARPIPPTASGAKAAPAMAHFAETQKVDISRMSEEELKEVVYVQEGPHKGTTRYHMDSRAPIAPGGFSYTQWHQALERLRQIETQHDDGDVGGDDNLTRRRKSGQALSSAKDDLDDATRRVRNSQQSLAKQQQKNKRKSNRKGSTAGAKNRVQEAKRQQQNAKARHQDATEADKQTREDHPILKGVDKQVKGDIVNVGVVKERSLMEERHDGAPGPLGGEREGYTKIGTAKAEGRGKVSVGKDGVDASLSANAKVALVDFSEELHWERPFKLLGEGTKAKLYVKVEGMVGAEGKAGIEANLRRIQPQDAKVPRAELGAAVEGFAGAKLKTSAGIAYEWEKKDHTAYLGKLNRAAQVVIDLATASMPGLGFLLRQLGADEAVESVLEWLFKWGQPGTVPLAEVEAYGEGCVGAGGKIGASIGLRGGQFKFRSEASGTWGVGLGAGVNVTLDVVEGTKFSLLMLGELREMALNYARQQLGKIGQRGIDLSSKIWKWLSAWWTSDDKARETVQQRGHEFLPPAKRGELVRTMYGGYYSNEDQECVVRILEFSAQRGDLSRVVDDQLLRDLLSSSDAAAHQRIAKAAGWRPWK